MRKQANRGRKDQRREKKEEETHHEISVTVDRNNFYRKLHDFLQEVLYFYQKNPVEAFGQARINYGDVFEA